MNSNSKKYFVRKFKKRKLIFFIILKKFYLILCKVNTEIFSLLYYISELKLI